MKRTLLVLAGVLMAGAVSVSSHARLPPAPPKSEVEKAAEAQKAAATKAKDAELLGQAQEKAVANYRKNTARTIDTKSK